MRLAALFASLTFLYACAPQNAPEDQSNAPAPARPMSAAKASEIKAGVASLLRSWASAQEEGRWDEVKSLYADDPNFYWVERGALAYADHDAIVAGLDQVTSMNATIKNRLGDIAVTPLADDAASFRAHLDVDFTSDQFSFSMSGMLTGVTVLRDGRWVFLQGNLARTQTGGE